MIIFLDTNVIFQEGFLRSLHALALLRAAHFLGFKIIIPEIVVDEVKGNFAHTLKKKLAAYAKPHRELAELIKLAEFSPSVENEVEEYENWLDTILEEYGVVVPPYPQVPLKEIVTESYRGEKPFKTDGDGHKDYLIWKTISTYITQSPLPAKAKPEIYFLTNNINDFCEKVEDKHVLHSSLASQVEESKKPVIYLAIQQFFEEKITPLLEGIDLSNIPELGREKIEETTERKLEETLYCYATQGFEEAYFNGDCSATLIDAAEIDKISLTVVDEDEILITVSGSVSLEVDGYLDKSEYYSEDCEDVRLVDGDWNEYVVAVSKIIKTPFELVLSYSKESKEITGHTLTLLNEVEDDRYQ